MAQYRKKSDNDPVYGFLAGLFKAIWWLIAWPFRGQQHAALAVAKADMQRQWATIESYTVAGQWREAIMNADILLDKALRFHHASGASVGERLKAAGHHLPKWTLDQAWRAHKVRNNLAHELHYQLAEAEAKAAISDFKQVLMKFGLL